MSIRFTKLRDKVIEWAQAQEILTKATPASQYLKLGEEFGEIKEAIAGHDYEKFVDAIGDNAVVLILLVKLVGKDAELYQISGARLQSDDGIGDLVIYYGKLSKSIQEGTPARTKCIAMHCFAILDEIAQARASRSMVDCLEAAYGVISKRKGKMVDGVFVKEEAT